MGKLKWHITLVLALWLVFCGMASATQLYVNETGWWRDSGAFYGSETPIQAAVNAADNGDSIFVWDGSYTENVDVNKRLTLVGEGADVVIVNAANAEDHVFWVTANWVTISGFTVTGAKNMYAKKAGIYLHYADHCSICSNNASNNVYGICLKGSSNNNMITDNTVNSNNVYGIYLFWYNYGDFPTNNTFTNNAVNSNADDGIFLGPFANNNTLTDNIVNSNGGDGIYIVSTNNTLTGNHATWNTNIGIQLSGSNNTLTNNIVNSNEYGIYGVGGDGNTLTNNIANSNACTGICLSGSSNMLTNNIANSNDVGICISHSSTLTNNTVSNNWDGIKLSGSSNTLTNNTVSSNSDDGVVLFFWSNYNTLTDNTVNSNGGDGIYLDSSSNNTLYNNTINSNDRGIYLSSSSDNIITCNCVQNNAERGFYLWESTGNNISCNNIIENGDYNAPSSGWEWQFYLDQQNPVEAKHNYWGAGMNNDTIDASIHDDEEGKGKVEFHPFEADPVPCAPGPDHVSSPVITSFTPASPVDDTEDATRVFNITTAQTVDVSWLINGTIVQDTNTSITTASYTNTSAALGVWNVSAIASNANGYGVQTWIWNVTSAAARIPGDVTGDGVVNIGDAVLLFNWVSFPNERGTTYVLSEPDNANVNGDTTTNIGDAVLLFNWVSFPNERGTTYVLK